MTQVIPTLDLEGKEPKADLQSLLMSIPDPSKPSKKLFYAVNNQGSANGIIFWYHPQKSNNAHTVVDMISNMWTHWRYAWISHLQPTCCLKLLQTLNKQNNILQETIRQWYNQIQLKNNKLLDYTEMITYPSTDECASQTHSMDFKMAETVLPETSSGWSNGRLQMIAGQQNKLNHLYGQYICILFPSKYSMCHWLAVCLFLQQTTAWDMWRYWNSVVNTIEIKSCFIVLSLDLICMTHTVGSHA